MLAYLSGSSLLTVFPRRFFIRRNSRSAIRSRSRSPQQVTIAAAVVSANIRNFASLTRRDLSRSGTFSASPLVFVNIGTLACSSSLPIHRRIEGAGISRACAPVGTTNDFVLEPLSIPDLHCPPPEEDRPVGKPALGAAGAGCRLTRPFYRTGCLLIHVVGSIHSGQA